ncbi:MAG: hypothetical protein GEU74_08945 [Nitriliruptorales bacterium]|nr:hypothetical protein [Nitriliruptorales bacterium]
MQRVAALLAVAVLASSGCAPSRAGDPFTAVATVYPLAWVIGEIAPHAEVVSLAAQGQDPHDQELSPQQRGLLERADLVAYVGDIGFQPQVEAAVDQAGGAVVSVVDVVGHEAMRELGDGHDDEEGAHDGEAGRAEDGAIDPHFWFDARLMAKVATAVGENAAEADPANATAYRDAARDVTAEMESLAGDIEQLLRSCRHDHVIVSHEAYGYLLEPHGLEQEGISGADGHSEASPADIARLAAEIRERQLPAVLTEPVEGRTDAEVVAREAGVDLVEIYSLDIVDAEQADKALPQLLREQADAVVQAAACGP